MCGRYTLTNPEAVIQSLSPGLFPRELESRFNIAPTQKVPIIRFLEEPVLAHLRWGLVPPWSEADKLPCFINARSETAAEKPSFRKAFEKRRCLVPADGFLEWERSDAGKLPWWFQLKESRGFAMAGIWETWRGPDERKIESFAILTTRANGLVGKIHDRMPVILQPEHLAEWLSPDVAPEFLGDMMVPFSEEDMVRTRVTTQVNDARNQGPEVLVRE